MLALIIAIAACALEAAVIWALAEYIKLQNAEIRSHDPLDPVTFDE